MIEPSAAGGHGDSRVHRFRDILSAFLPLGLTSFGGPIAHLGYFRREFVERRRWITEDAFAQLLALCQFLPGPASSQMGFSIGLIRGGWIGAALAFLAFTLPSALLLFAFATQFPKIDGPVGRAAVHGLELVALAVVAHAVWGMARRLCPDPARAVIAILSAAALLTFGDPWVQLLVVAGGGLAGAVLCRHLPTTGVIDLTVRHGTRTGWALLATFGLLLICLAVAGQAVGGRVAVAEAFYRSGALVFGGGHVVLPLLEEAVVAPGWVSAQDFLAGYGAAQAVPGPLFTFAAYLGAILPAPNGGAVGALVGVAAIFLPGFLLVAGILPLWESLARRAGATRVVAGVNAAVVGLLAAALYDPVWTSAVGKPVDVAIGLIGFALLAAWRVPAILVVGFCVLASVASS